MPAARPCCSPRWPSAPQPRAPSSRSSDSGCAAGGATLRVARPRGWNNDAHEDPRHRADRAPVSALFAVVHHLAAFALVACLAIEFVLIRGELGLQGARRLQRVDMVFGISSGIVLLVGLLRVFYFEKGASYYFHSWPFLAKLLLFLAVGLLSIPPTMEILSWRVPLRLGQAPAVSEERRRWLRRFMHLELAGVLLILLCAALMARGLGTFG